MPIAPATATPLNALWQAPVIVWVVLAGEGLAAVLTLAPGAANDRLIYFGLTSMLIQWVSFLTLGGLYLLRHALTNVRPQYVAYLALGLLGLAAFQNHWRARQLPAWARRTRTASRQPMGSTRSDANGRQIPHLPTKRRHALA